MKYEFYSFILLVSDTKRYVCLTCKILIHMKNALTTLLFGALIIAFSGCAPVKFYSNPGLTQKSGLKFYTVKPFVLVERDPVSNNILKATILYLPDLENPQYMKIKDGPGSRKVDLKLDNGSISSFGVTSDGNLDETIEAMAALISKGTGALTDLAALKGLPVAASQPVVELYEVFMNSGTTSVRKVEIK
jgi:hypothetical protein